MKKILLTIIMLISVTVLFFAQGTIAFANAGFGGECGVNGDNLKWNLDSGVLTISGTGGMKNYGMFINSAPWKIADEYIKEIVIQDEVKSIGAYAFYDCSYVEKITIGKSVENISDYAFYGCSRLTDLYCNAKKINDIPLNSYVFDYCGTAVDGFTVYFGNEVDFVPANMFYLSLHTVDVKSVCFGSSVKIIGENAFKKCNNISSINIPASVEHIGEGAFSDCSGLSEILVHDDNLYYTAVDNVIYTKNKQVLVFYPLLKTNSEYCVLSETIRIESYAFFENKYIEKVYLNENLSAIEKGAFKNCENLKYLEWSAKNISDSNFGDGVFENSGSLLDGFKVQINSNVENLPKQIFKESNISEITINAELSNIPENAFYNCKMLKIVNLSDTIETINDFAFNNCDSLTNIDLPENLKKVKNRAFYDCDSLIKISFNDNVQSIYSHVFYDCDLLEEVVFSDSIDSIGNWAFWGCSFLKKIKLPNNDELSLGSNAFSDCTGLIEIEIPENVKYIDLSVFFGSTSLKKLIFIAPSYKLEGTNVGNVSNFTVYAHAGGNIESFAKESAFPFEEIHTYYEEVVCTATCIEAGEKYNLCKFCDKKINVEKVDAIVHTEETIPGKPVTCTEKGITEGKKCSVCGEILVTQEEIPATGHSYTTVVTAPTCTEKGYTTYTCFCGFSDRRDYVLAIGHNYKKEVIEPTCTENGFTVYSCHCGEAFSPDEVILAPGHTPGEWEVVTESQVGVEGKEQQKCIVCDEVLDEKTIPAIPDVTYTPGDVNGDGKVNAIDARTILRISAQLDKIENYNLPVTVFDLTGDGKVNALDARKALRIGAQLE